MLKELRKLVLPLYRLNDISHKINHAEDVVKETVKICRTLNVSELDTLCAVVAAWSHDVQCHVDRKCHHILAHSWVYRNKESILNTLPADIEDTATFITKVANACYEHRSSYKGEYSNVVSEIVAAADNGEPVIDLDIYKRSYMYARHVRNLSHVEAAMHAHEHINDKYGIQGYSKYSSVFTKMYGDAITRRANWISKVTLDEIASAACKWVINK